MHSNYYLAPEFHVGSQRNIIIDVKLHAHRSKDLRGLMGWVGTINISCFFPSLYTLSQRKGQYTTRRAVRNRTETRTKTTKLKAEPPRIFRHAETHNRARWVALFPNRILSVHRNSSYPLPPPSSLPLSPFTTFSISRGSKYSINFWRPTRRSSLLSHPLSVVITTFISLSRHLARTTL